jgi:hypothetical protein
MAVTLNNNTDCCESTCTNTTVNVAGPQGPAGAAGSNGTNGSNGVNAYAFTTAGFTVPSVNQNVSLSVDNATPWATGMIIFVQVAGYYEVVGTSGGTINAKNLGYTGNAAVGQAIATNRLIAGAGIKGDTGTSGTTFSGFTNAGDIITRDGSAQTVLSVDSTPDTTKALFQHNSGNYITWKKVAAADLDGNISLTSQVSGSLPLANVGNGISGAAAGDLLYWTGTAWARVAAPTSAEQLLGYNTGTNEPNWVSPSTSGLLFAKGSIECNAAGTFQSKTSAANIGQITTTTSGAGGVNRWEINFESPAASTNYIAIVGNSNTNQSDTGDADVFRVYEKQTSKVVVGVSRDFDINGNIGYNFDLVVYQ